VLRGEEYLKAGQIAAARLVLQRAADAHDPRGTLMLGASYDPIILDRLGVLGLAADAETARVWYEKAKEFGSSEAPRRIEMLASWNH
jgi:TPR repeat protein